MRWRLIGSALWLSLCLLIGSPVQAQLLYVGLEDASLPTKTSDLNGFPTVNWVNHFPFEMNGAACARNQTLYPTPETSRSLRLRIV
jgi:hypothetical protein